LDEDVLQDIVREVFVAHQSAGQEKEQGAAAVDQDFECALIAALRFRIPACCTVRKCPQKRLSRYCSMRDLYRWSIIYTIDTAGPP